VNVDVVFDRLAAAVEVSRARVARLGSAGVERERSALILDEIRTSSALAGARLDRDELSALVERGFVLGGRPFNDYAVAAGYAAAARMVADAEPVRDRRLVRPGEIVALHALATRYDDRGVPGAWRVTTAPTLRSGIVPPPFWLVPREVAGFGRRFGARVTSDEPLLFVARAHQAFTRIHPFTVGNGRVARLLANLMLRRLGLAPFIVGPSDVARYRKALIRADSGDIWPLAAAIGRSVLASLARLEAAARPGDLRPISSFARGTAREALYKAVQRDRLRAIRRGRAIYTTRRWIDEYRRSTGADGRD
jgi:hypothetical protein